MEKLSLNPQIDHSANPPCFSPRDTTSAWKNAVSNLPVNTDYFNKLFQADANKQVALTVWEKVFDRAKVAEFSKKQTIAEDVVQAFVNTMHSECSAFLSSTVVIRDTSITCAPLQPWHRFDHCGVVPFSVSTVCDSQVSWSDIVWIEQLKKSSNIVDAQLQIIDGAYELFKKQPDRQCCIGLVGNGREIGFMKVNRHRQGHGAGAMQYSGLLPFISASREQVPDGFVLYVGLLRTSLFTLGYHHVTDPILPHLSTSKDILFSTLLRCGDTFKPDVFAVYFKDGSTAVVKRYEQDYLYKSEALLLNKFGGVHVPTLLEKFDTVNCLLIEPAAESTLFDLPFSPVHFTRALEACHIVLQRIHAEKYVHGDVTPRNVLVKGDQFYLNDYSESAEVGKRVEFFVGTLEFAAPQWSASVSGGEVQRTILLDYIGLFFTLLYYAQAHTAARHRSLPWTGKSELEMWMMKASLLHNYNDVLGPLLDTMPHCISAFLHNFAQYVFIPVDDPFDHAQLVQFLDRWLVSQLAIAR